MALPGGITSPWRLLDGGSSCDHTHFWLHQAHRLTRLWVLTPPCTEQMLAGLPPELAGCREQDG